MMRGGNAETGVQHGVSGGDRMVFGSTGSMTLPGDRSGGEFSVHFDGNQGLAGEALLAQVAGFALDANTAALFGAERFCGYDQPFPVTDARLLAIEYGGAGRRDPGRRATGGDAEQGMSAVAQLLRAAGIGGVRGRRSASGTCSTATSTPTSALDESLGLTTPEIAE